MLLLVETFDQFGPETNAVKPPVSLVREAVLSPALRRPCWANAEGCDQLHRPYSRF